jgi:hypothetical protein
MLAEHIVIVPPKTKVEFADLCVGCGAQSPMGTARVWSINWELKHEPMFVSVRVPACPPCTSVMWFQRLLRGAVVILMLVAGIAVYTLFPDSWHGRGTLGVLVCGALLVLTCWDWAFPPWFDFAHGADNSLYSFRSAEAAEGFKKLNVADGPAS